MDQMQQEIQSLQEQLSECLVARGGLADDFGRLLTSLYTKQITRLTRDITSDKYRKDHVGYNNALSELHAYQTILKSLQIAAAPQREAKLREKLSERENG